MPIKYRVTLAIMVKWSVEEAYGLSNNISGSVIVSAMKLVAVTASSNNPGIFMSL